MPACKIIMRTMIGKVAESEIDKVTVSDNTVSRRVDNISHDVEDVLCKILKILTLLYKSTSQQT
jgi:hypothetical protein